MTRRPHIERALRACADAGVPELVDPWPGIRERALARRRRALLRGRFVPRTRVRLVLAVLLVTLLGMGAYTASGLLEVTFQDELPGGDAVDLGQKLDLTRTANGAQVTLEWAYADQESVVVGLNIEELDENRRAAGYPAELQPAYPNKLTDESEVVFHETDGQFYGTEGSSDPMQEVPVSIVFDTKGKIEAGGSNHFRLEVPVAERPLPPSGKKIVPEGSSEEGVPYQVPLGDPFVFDFEVPVRPAPTVQVDQKVEADGVTLTLDHVVDSPARPAARICYGSPDTDYDWTFGGDAMYPSGGGPQIGEHHRCSTALLPDPLEGGSTLTIERLEGIPRCPPGNENGCSISGDRIKTIDGPWTFEFEVPER